ncbi:MAG: hypothetical protein IH820_09420, partial [Bacteroidetes bacterium]|nr:hypothetical protein [Bacteroidota bacterium]
MLISSFASPFRGAGLVLALVLLGPVAAASAQGYIDQEAVADLLNLRAETLDDIPEVFYEY